MKTGGSAPAQRLRSRLPPAHAAACLVTVLAIGACTASELRYESRAIPRALARSDEGSDAGIEIEPAVVTLADCADVATRLDYGTFRVRHPNAGVVALNSRIEHGNLEAQLTALPSRGFAGASGTRVALDAGTSDQALDDARDQALRNLTNAQDGGAAEGGAVPHLGRQWFEVTIAFVANDDESLAAKKSALRALDSQDPSARAELLRDAELRWLTTLKEDAACDPQDDELALSAAYDLALLWRLLSPTPDPGVAARRSDLFAALAVLRGERRYQGYDVVTNLNRSPRGLIPYDQYQNAVAPPAPPGQASKRAACEPLPVSLGNSYIAPATVPWRDVLAHQARALFRAREAPQDLAKLAEATAALVRDHRAEVRPAPIAAPLLLRVAAANTPPGAARDALLARAKALEPPNESRAQRCTSP